jgi:hypothetical protein
MSPRAIASLAAIIVAIALVVWWWPSSGRASRIAAQSATSNQRRLWDDVARRGTPQSLERLPVANPPIQGGGACGTPTVQVPPASARPLHHHWEC